MTSYETIAKDVNLTSKQVRTVLRDLQETNELAKQSSRKGSIISIVNWDQYQCEGKQTAQKWAGKGQEKGSKRASNKNDKNDNNEKEIIDHLNLSCGKSFKHTTPNTRDLIRARVNEGYGLDDFKKVIDTKSAQWKDNQEMNQYLRPKTLFGTKFESYLNENNPEGESMKVALELLKMHDEFNEAGD